VLRQHARAWLSALCGAFAATASAERGPLAAAITAYAAVADAETAAQYFRIAIQKLIKVCVHVIFSHHPQQHAAHCHSNFQVGILT